MTQVLDEYAVKEGFNILAEKHDSDFENDKKSTQITLDAFRKSKLRKV